MHIEIEKPQIAALECKLVALHFSTCLLCMFVAIGTCRDMRLHIEGSHACFPIQNIGLIKDSFS